MFICICGNAILIPPELVPALLGSYPPLFMPVDDDVLPVPVDDPLPLPLVPETKIENWQQIHTLAYYWQLVMYGPINDLSNLNDNSMKATRIWQSIPKIFMYAIISLVNHCICCKLYVFSFCTKAKLPKTKRLWKQTQEEFTTLLTGISFNCSLFRQIAHLHYYFRCWKNHFRPS